MLRVKIIYLPIVYYPYQNIYATLGKILKIQNYRKINNIGNTAKYSAQVIDKISYLRYI